MSEKKFDLNVEKILENWEVFDGIREVIANAIDEEILTKTDTVKIFKDKAGNWHIRDFGRGLSYQHLTQKENDEKLNNPHVIGKSGIGLKDALATFDRNKVKVCIKSSEGDITIKKAVKHDFEDLLTLHAIIRPPTEPDLIGTEVVLENCPDKEMEKAKDLFLRFSGEKLLEKTRYGEILEKKNENARIYVNGVRVAEEENFLFSYNITSITKAIRRALNRERTNVGRSAYSGRVKMILLDSKKQIIAKTLVNDLKEYQSGNLHDELKWTDVNVHACRILNSLEKVVFITPEQLITSPNLVEKAQADNYELITIPSNIKENIAGLEDISGESMRDLDQFQVEWNESFQFKFVDENRLSSSEQKIFGMTKPILKLVGGKPSKVKKIRISETMRLDPSSFREANGLWDEGNQSIIIKRNQLRSLEDHAGTLLHEVAHVISNDTDVSIGFEHQLTAFLGRITKELFEDTSSQGKKKRRFFG